MTPCRVTAAAMIAAIAGTAFGQSTLPFPERFELASLKPGNGGDGSDGFVVFGQADLDELGVSISAAGDLNGDGIDDLVVGAWDVAAGGTDRGQTLVIFGKDTAVSGPFPASFSAAALDGTTGFVVNGVADNDMSGRFVAGAGDINGDGLDDLLIGASRAPRNGYSQVGESYVIFGRNTAMSGPFAPSLDLSSLNGTNGFVIPSIENGSYTGTVSGAGDLNGDGITDLMIGASKSDLPSGNDAGKTYVIFGAAGLGSTGSFVLSTLNGANGFVLNGIRGGDLSGDRLDRIGDFNGDGVDDIIIGARGADPNIQNNQNGGQAYIIFGRNTAQQGNFAAAIEISALNGTDGFILNGINAFDNAGRSVSGTGDVNGDGFDDVIIGAWRANPGGYGAVNDAGESYIVFGGPSVGSSGLIELTNLNGSDGFTFEGVELSDQLGFAVAGAGDINGDGVDDMLISSRYANPDMIEDAGECYVIFGRDTSVFGEFPVRFNRSSLTGAEGFVLFGENSRDRAGQEVACIGDVNNDGIDDIAIGAILAGTADAGEAYIVFGRDVGPRVWDSTTGGLFDLATNWLGDVAPGPLDVTLVDNQITGTTDAAFGININPTTPDPIVRALGVRTDDVSISFNGKSLTLTDPASLAAPGLSVGGLPDKEARLRLINALGVEGVLSAVDAVVGPEPTDTMLEPLSLLIVEDPTTRLDTSGRLVVGSKATNAEARIIDGALAQVGAELIVGLEAGSSGLLSVFQSLCDQQMTMCTPSTLQLTGTATGIIIGGAGDAEVVVADKGVIETTGFLDSTTLARDATSDATLRIEGDSSSVTLVHNDLFIGGAGSAALEIRAGGTLQTTTFNELVLADEPGSSASVVIDGSTSNWTETSQRITLAGAGDATLTLENDGVLTAPIGITNRAGGAIEGQGSINTSILSNFGDVDPGSDLAAGVLSIDGSFRQRGVPPGGSASESGALSVDVFGAGTGDIDRLDLSGDVELSGRLGVAFAQGFVPDPDTFGPAEFISASSNVSASRFDVALMPGIPDGADGMGRFLRVDYPLPVADSRGIISVSLVVDTLSDEINVDPAQSFDVDGAPVAAATADFGGGPGGQPDGFVDIAIVVPDATDPVANPGDAIVLFNAGTDSGGAWLGFTGGTLQAPVGRDPSAIAAGDIDNDGLPDAVVTNRADDSFTVLRNDGAGNLVPDPSIGVGDAPGAVALGDFDLDNGTDIAVANTDDDTITVLTNLGGSGDGWNGVSFSSLLPTGGSPVWVGVVNSDDDKWDDLTSANASGGTLSFLANSGGANFAAPISLPVGEQPVQVIGADLDLDGRVDLATVNQAGGSVSILKNTSSGIGDYSFAPSVELPIGPAAFSIAAVDLDSDPQGDLDLAIVADGGSGSTVVKVLRNDLTGGPGGDLIFTLDDDLATGPDPRFVLGADVDNAEGNDVLTINAGTTIFADGDRGPVTMTLDAVSVLAQAPAPAFCEGDADASGTVDFADITEILRNWLATYAPGSGGPGDADGNGTVDFADITAALRNWLRICP